MSDNWYYNNQFNQPPPSYPSYQYEQPNCSYNNYWPPSYPNGQFYPIPNLNEPPPSFNNNNSNNYANSISNSNLPNYPTSTYNNRNYENYNYYPNFTPESQNNYSRIDKTCEDFINNVNNNRKSSYDFKDELEVYKNKKFELQNKYGNKKWGFDKGLESKRGRNLRNSRSPCSKAKFISSCHESPSNKNKKFDDYRTSRCKRSRSYSPKKYDSSSPYGRKTLSPSKGSEREEILKKWKKDYCSTQEEVCNKIKNLSKEDPLEEEKLIWTRTTPADLYYVRDEKNPKVMRGTERLQEICKNFEENLVLRAKKVNELKPKYEPPPRKNRARICKHKTEQSSSSDSSDENFTDEEDCSMEELTRKQQHPDRLHPEMWYNDPGEMNDGPLCRCSRKARKTGIRHGIYAGEQFQDKCDINTNNADKLYHYRITISPPTNFLIKTPTIIQHDEHEFIFEGFSMMSHKPLVKLPTCKVIRFNIEYTIFYIEDKIPDNFTIKELDLFYEYLFKEVLELVDLDLKASGDSSGCSQFHFMPRFARNLPDNGKEILSMKEVLQYLMNGSVPLIRDSKLNEMINMSQYEWQSYADEIKGMVVTYPGKKPCSVRVDQLDRNLDLQKKCKDKQYKFPEIVHFGIRPPQLSYAGNPEYQKAWRDYVKFRHLLANMSKPTYEDKRKLEYKENKLQGMRTQSKMKRDVTVVVSAEGFYRTGIMCDIVQHSMLIPVLVCHLRFHNSLCVLENTVNYEFNNRGLLQLALTHPSYRENFGTNPDHARNTLTNCGIRQPEYGDRRIHYMNTRKRGINTLINIMSRFGKKEETESNITHNERLEFLGDAVVEFLSSIHLFYTFPDLEEGGLATYRAAIVQNQHLAVLARTLNLDHYMLYAHGSDLCHDLELRHAMANCFEALMGALFLDGAIDVADRVFSETLFKEHLDLLEVWQNLPPHPLQQQEPRGDREWIPKFKLLQKLTEFENSIGVEFTHIRLLARGFTDRSVGYTNLTLGSNQRLEFLGDTVLQLIASEYLYKYFPEHHEGHLSLLRSSLVNNRTQAVVCDDLGMANYAVYNNPKAELKTKDRADLLEAFIGALYVDKGLEFCQVFCQVTLFPRLQDFIMNQDWNDPKSKLQQCCLTLRTMDGGEPDIPVYKVIECKGPTNTRVYTVAVYFRSKRLASAMGHSIQQAEMNAAKKALEISKNLFPQLDHQKRVIAKSMKKQKYPHRRKSCSRSRSRSRSGRKKKKNDYRKRSKSCRSRSYSKERSKSNESQRSSSHNRSKLETKKKSKYRRRSNSDSSREKYYRRKSKSRSDFESDSSLERNYKRKSHSKSRSVSNSFRTMKSKSRSRSKSDSSQPQENKFKYRNRSYSNSSRERSLKRKSRSVSNSSEKSCKRQSKFKNRSSSVSSGENFKKSASSMRSRSNSSYKSVSKSPSKSRSSSRTSFTKNKSRSKSLSLPRRSKSRSSSNSSRRISESQDVSKRSRFSKSNSRNRSQSKSSRGSNESLNFDSWRRTNSSFSSNFNT